ncbi:MAG: hypothetical protein ACRDH2_12445 [Anaerolineales bacterium]
MAYIDPTTVVSPKNRVRNVTVLHDEGPGKWSVALLEWEDKEGRKEVLALRWNGSDEKDGIGNPQSRGKPTWFIVPDALAEFVRDKVESLIESREGGLLEGYRAMAEDHEQETEALEWSEALIGDAIGEEG